MKAKNLRIGNLLDLYGTIATLQGSDFYHHFSNDNRKLSRFKPLEINEHWLISLGFSKNVRKLETIYRLGQFEYATSCKSIDIEFEGLECCITHTTDVKYVHELQNLFFAFTGTELEYKQLPK